MGSWGKTLWLGENFVRILEGYIVGKLDWEVRRKPYEVRSGGYIGRLGESLMVGRNDCEVTSGGYIWRLGENLVR